MTQLTIFSDLPAKAKTDDAIAEFVFERGICGATGEEVAVAFGIDDTEAVKSLIRLHNAKRLQPAYHRGKSEFVTREHRIVYIPAPGAVVDLEA